MLPTGMEMYARLCGWTLGPGTRPCRRPASRWPPTSAARPSFDQAIADFAETYADQNELDYAALQAAVKAGKAEATTEI